MATLLEKAQQIVSAHAATTPMSTSELVAELQKVHATLQALEAQSTILVSQLEEEPAAPAISIRQAFKANEVLCMICGKGGMKTLTRHLSQAHQMKPSQYRKQFKIPKTQPLMSKNYFAKRKEIAAGMDLGANLAKARAKRQENVAVKKAKVPAVRVKAPVPAVRRKAAVPAVKVNHWV